MKCKGKKRTFTKINKRRYILERDLGKFIVNYVDGEGNIKLDDILNHRFNVYLGYLKEKKIRKFGR